MSRRATWLLALLLPAGCGQAPDAGSLFPLEPGHRWVFDVRTEWETLAVEHETRMISTEGAADVAGVAAWRRRSADGVDWYLRADDSGVYRVGAKTDLDDQPTPDPQRRYVLKAPIAVGTSWQSVTVPYLLRRKADFPPEIRHSQPPVTMTYTIEALDERVETRGGRFERCVRVGGLAQLKLFADPVSGWRDLPLRTTEWYCHGPGLVKLVREEPANSNFLVGGVLTMELLTWN
jgi:hypothetical protein